MLTRRPRRAHVSQGESVGETKQFRRWWLRACLSLGSAMGITTAHAAALPALPPSPQLNVSAYPTCQSDWISAHDAGKIAQLQLISTCANALEIYNQNYLKPFPPAVHVYTESLLAEESNFQRSNASQADKQAFQAEVRAAIEQVASKDSTGICGQVYRLYYVYFQKYQADVAAMWNSYRSINT